MTEFKLGMDVNLVEKIRRAVCAIGYSKAPRPGGSGGGLQSNFEIMGTGFLVRQGLVMTCTHVLDDLTTEMKKRRIPMERRFAQFVYSVEVKAWRTDFRPFKDGHRIDAADLALVKLQGLPVAAEPVEVASPDYPPSVGEQIAVCGYAHGSILLARGNRIRRFGPLLLQGSIAALSPYDVPHPESILLDRVVAPCASGSPVFRVENGQVIGVVVEGQEGKSAIVSVARTIQDDRGKLLARVTKPLEIRPDASAAPSQTTIRLKE
jgi:hypothetical protein